MARKPQVKHQLMMPSLESLETSRALAGVNALLVINRSFQHKKKEDLIMHKVFVYRSTDNKFNTAASLVIDCKFGVSFLVPSDYDFNSRNDLEKFQIVSDKKFSDPTFLLKVATTIADCVDNNKSILVPFSESSLSVIEYKSVPSLNLSWLERVMKLVGA